jgi:hypothetical protein
MPRADWNVLKKYSLPKPSDGLLAVFNDTVRPITAQCLLADISARDSRNGALWNVWSGLRVTLV